MTLDLQRECISFRWVEDWALTSEKCAYVRLQGKGIRGIRGLEATDEEHNVIQLKLHNEREKSK